MMFYALVALCLSGSVLAQVPGRGRCPHVHAQQTFDHSRYVGRWFEHARFFALFELDSKCTILDYTRGRNNTLDVLISQVSGVSGHPESFSRTLQTPNPSRPGEKLVNIPMGVYGLSPLLVLGTDYQNYAVLYTCMEFSGQLFIQYAWILTRHRNANAVTVRNAYAVVARNGIDESLFWKTDQHLCRN